MRSSWALPLLSLAPFAFSQVIDPTCPAGYQRSIEWGPCGGSDTTLACATMDVPQNWVNNNGSITIPLLRVNATVEPVRGTVFYNPGGPGTSAINYLAYGGRRMQQMIGQDWNIITFDPRGVNLNTPYMCKAVGSYGNPNLFNNGTDGFNSVAEYYGDQAAACAPPAYADADSGKYVGTAADATDIVAVYEALSRNAGEDGKIYYYGYSYGTLLGSTLSQMYPSKVARVVLDGNINPTDYYDNVGYETLVDYDKEVRLFFQQCVEAKTNCSLYKDSTTTQQSLNDQFDNFISTTGANNFNGLIQFQGNVFNAMYGPSRWITLATYLDGVLNKGAAINSYPRSQKRAAFTFDPFADPIVQQRILVAITCGDARVRFGKTGAAFQQYYQTFFGTSKYGTNNYIDLPFSCQAWEVDAAQKPQGPFTGIAPTAKILYLNGRYDPVTPLLSAQNSAAGFAGAGVLISDGAGHCTTAQPSSELQLAAALYLITGEIPAKRQNYTLNQPNPFLKTVVPTPGASNDTQAGNSTNTVTARDVLTGVSAADLAAALEFMGELHAAPPLIQYELPNLDRRREEAHARSFLYARQNGGIPAGCLPINGSIVTTTASVASSTAASTLSTTASSASASGSDTTSASASDSSFSSSASVSGSASTASTASTTSGGNVGPTIISTTSATSTASGSGQVSSQTSSSIYSTSSSMSTITSKPTWVYPTSASTSTSYSCPGKCFTKTVTYTDCETRTECAPGVAHCPPHTITHTKTSHTVVPTITSWWADLTDVCPTGIATHHVPITHHCSTGCDSRPTGVPEGYTTTKAWCSACQPQAWVEATVPVRGWPAVESEAAAKGGHGGKGGDDDDYNHGGHGGKPGNGNGNGGDGGKPVADAQGAKPDNGNGGNGGWNGQANNGGAAGNGDGKPVADAQGAKPAGGNPSGGEWSGAGGGSSGNPANGAGSAGGSGDGKPVADAHGAKPGDAEASGKVGHYTGAAASIEGSLMLSGAVAAMAVLGALLV